jgi:hypothetical protein
VGAQFFETFLGHNSRKTEKTTEGVKPPMDRAEDRGLVVGEEAERADLEKEEDVVDVGSVVWLVEVTVRSINPGDVNIDFFGRKREVEKDDDDISLLISVDFLSFCFCWGSSVLSNKRARLIPGDDNFDYDNKNNK